VIRRFLLLVFVSFAMLPVAYWLWPRQLDGFVAMFSQHTTVNRGVAVTVLGLLTALLLALRVRLWRSQRDLARIQRGLLESPPPLLVYPPSPWGSRPAR
jgi:hypothetical protein